MREGDGQPILRCGRCNKPFDKQATLKRHGYYCRSRAEGTATRARSCVSCAKHKARCDNGRPACSRCIAKAIDCHYPAAGASARRVAAVAAGDASDAGDATLQLSGGHVDSLSGAADGPLLLDNAMSITGSELATIDSGNLTLGSNDPNIIDFTDFLTPQYSSSSAFPTLAYHQGQHALSPSNLFIPPQPTYSMSSACIRSLIQRPRMEPSTQRTATLILHTLKSYPLMMLRHNTLPPFIHPHLASAHVADDDMEPLNNCITLIHMIGSGVPGSHKLFWKNVRMECHRLCEDVLELSKWQLLTAMQALAIYIIIRLEEGETEHNDFDLLLVATVSAIAKQLGHVAPTRDSGLEMDWKDWIFEESRRRLCVVFRVVDMLLVHFEPGSMCHLHQTGLVISPLPSKKLLWEAAHELQWKAEIERDPISETVFALASNGGLVRLDHDAHSQQYDSEVVQLHKPMDTRMSRSSANWGEWCSGMDGFGGLVMLAASLTT